MQMKYDSTVEFPLCRAGEKNKPGLVLETGMGHRLVEKAIKRNITKKNK